MSSLGGLYIGASGLNVSQTSLNVTAHNLANVDTKGFVRQQAVLSDFHYIKIGDTHISPMQLGLGSSVATVKQVRDTFLDKAYRLEYGRQEYYDSHSKAVDEVEGFFGELEGVSFQNNLQDLWTSLQEVAKEPDSTSARSSLIQTAVTFTERAENIANQLKDYQVNLNTQIKNQVSSINDIGSKLKDLNFKIRKYESSGVENANDLRDQRNSLLDELGGIANITYKENADGVVNVNLEGVPFVTEDTFYPMGTEKMSDTSDMLKPVWTTYGNVDVFNFDKIPSSTDNTDIGSLKGLLVARGSKQANYTDIPLREKFDSDAEYNSAVTDYNKTVDSSVIMSTQAEFDQLVHGIVTTINNILCPNKEVTLTDGSTIKILDEENAPVGMDSNNTVGEALFNRKSMDRYSEAQEINVLNEDGSTSTITAKIYNGEDPSDNYSLFTLGEIEVNPKILQDYSYIPLSSNTGSGDYDMKTTDKLISKWQEQFATLSPNSLTENNFDDYYTSFISDIANRGEKADTIGKDQADMVESIDNQRQAVSGVSSDEELTNMIKYQHAYNASARYINVVDDMLKTMINNL